MSKFKEFKEQGDLFRPRPEWKRRGFKSREEYRKALEFDRAWRHMEQSNMTRLRKSALRKRKNWESLQTQLALRADEANRKWGYVPSRNPFGFGGTA